jgi:hypothetical protein
MSLLGRWLEKWYKVPCRHTGGRLTSFVSIGAYRDYLDGNITLEQYRQMDLTPQVTCTDCWKRLSGSNAQA